MVEEDLDHSHESLTIRQDQRQESPTRTQTQGRRNVLAALKLFVSRPEAIYLWFSFLFVVGAGLMYIHNIGSIVLALSDQEEGPDSSMVQSAQTFQVSLISIFNAVGRIMTGLGSDFAHRHYGIERIDFVIAAAAASMVGHTIGATLQNKDALWIPTIIIGSAYGQSLKCSDSPLFQLLDILITDLLFF